MTTVKYNSRRELFPDEPKKWKCVRCGRLVKTIFNRPWRRLESECECGMMRTFSRWKNSYSDLIDERITYKTKNHNLYIYWNFYRDECTLSDGNTDPKVLLESKCFPTMQYSIPLQSYDIDDEKLVAMTMLI